MAWTHTSGTRIERVPISLPISANALIFGGIGENTISILFLLTWALARREVVLVKRLRIAVLSLFLALRKSYSGYWSRARQLQNIGQCIFFRFLFWFSSQGPILCIDTIYTWRAHGRDRPRGPTNRPDRIY